jgi:hypothetical protein
MILDKNKIINLIKGSKLKERGLLDRYQDRS